MQGTRHFPLSLAGTLPFYARLISLNPPQSYDHAMGNQSFVNHHQFKIPKRVLYITLLLIFSSSTVGILADLETLYLLKIYLLLFFLNGGFFLIYLSIYRWPRRRLLRVKRDSPATQDP